MIQIICGQETYVYNVYHIVKAFYPSEEVTTSVEEKASNYVSVRFEDGKNIDIAQRAELENEDKQKVKNQIDKELYRKLAELTGKELAWGILTGVRPADCHEAAGRRHDRGRIRAMVYG